MERPINGRDTAERVAEVKEGGLAVGVGGIMIGGVAKTVPRRSTGGISDRMI